MTLKAMVVEWCLNETDTEPGEQHSWLGWDGWVSVDASYRQICKNISE